MPVAAREVNRASGTPQAVSEVLALRYRVVQAYDVSAVYVAEYLDLAEVCEDGPVRITAHRHARLEQDVRAWLRLGLALWVVRIRQTRMKIGDVIRSLQDNHCLRSPERSVQHLADVRRGLARHLDGSRPLDRVKPDRAQELKQSLPRTLIPAMNHEHPPRIRPALIAHLQSSLSSDAPTIAGPPTCRLGRNASRRRDPLVWPGRKRYLQRHGSIATEHGQRLSPVRQPYFVSWPGRSRCCGRVLRVCGTSGSGPGGGGSRCPIGPRVPVAMTVRSRRRAAA